MLLPCPRVAASLRGVLCTTAALAALVPASLSAQATRASDPAAPRSDDDLIQLNPFTVDAEAEESYGASTSVSGTRTRTEIANLPMSMQVFTDAFIKDLGAQNLIDVVTYASGVTEGTGQATNDGDDTNFTLRGQSSFLPMRNGFRRLRLVAAANIDRVEIIKGPASLLYGQLNPGGNVNYITKRPKPTQTFGEIRLEVGSYEHHRAVLDLNAPIVKNKLALRFVGSAQDTEAITDRYYQAMTLFNPSLTWWIRPETSLTVEYERSKRNTNAPRTNLPYANTISFIDRPGAIDRSWNASTSDDYFDTDMETFTAELYHRFNRNLALRANFTDAVWSEKKKINGTGINLQGPDLNLLPRRSLSYRDRGTWDEWQQVELVNNFTFKGVEVQNILGYQFEELQFRALLNGAQVTPSPAIQWDIFDRSTWQLTNLTAEDARIAPSTGNRSTNTTHSVYFANQLSFFEGRLRTLVGLRHDDFEVAAYNSAADTTTVTEAEPAKVPQVGVLYKVLQNLSVYATYSESFLPIFSTSRRADGSFYSPDPQTGEGMDFGVKGDFLDNKLSLTAAIFDVENTNIIRFLQGVTITNPDGTTETFSPTEQTGVERSTGFEFDARVRPFAGAQGIISYGYTDAYVKSDVQNPITRQGHQLANSPEHTFAFFWRQDLGDFGPAKKTFFTFGGRFVGERPIADSWPITDGVPVEPPRLKEYWVFNAGVGARFSVFNQDYRVGLNVKNLFDEIYMVHRYAYGAPREFQFFVSTRF